MPGRAGGPGNPPGPGAPGGAPGALPVRFIAFDSERGIVRAEAGLSVADLLEVIVPRGWFIPVSPGTQFVTLAGHGELGVPEHDRLPGAPFHVGKGLAVDVVDVGAER